MSKEVMKLALEALDAALSDDQPYIEKSKQAITALREALAEQPAQPQQEPYESPYNPNPVEYQYHYPDGSWKCSNGEVVNGMHPDKARSLYALKDNT